jgi:hypothetical protein
MAREKGSGVVDAAGVETDDVEILGVGAVGHIRLAIIEIGSIEYSLCSGA